MIYIKRFEDQTMRPHELYSVGQPRARYLSERVNGAIFNMWTIHDPSVVFAEREEWIEYEVGKWMITSD